MSAFDRIKQLVEPRHKTIARQLLSDPHVGLMKSMAETSEALGLYPRTYARDNTIELTERMVSNADFQEKDGAPVVWANPLAETDAYGLIRSIFVTGQLPKRGTKELMVAYSTMPRLRSAVQRLARDISSVPMKLYWAPTSAGKWYMPEYKSIADHAKRHAMKKALMESGDLQELSPDHPAYVFMRAGNLRLPGRKSRYMMQVFKLLKGDCYAILVRNNKGVPIRYYPIPPYWVIMAPTANRPFHRCQYGTWYCDVPEENMMWWIDADPANPYGRGVGVGESLADNLMTEKAGSRYQHRTLANNASPSQLVTVEGANRIQLDELEQRFNEKHLGIERAGKLHFTGTKIDVKSLEQNFREMELIKLRTYESDTIAECFHIPKELDGNLSTANRAAAGAVRYFYLEFTVTPWVEDEKEDWNYEMGSLFNGEIVADYEPFVPADEDKIQAFMTLRPSAFTEDEVREAAGYDPLGPAKGGDARYPIPTAAPALPPGKPAGKPSPVKPAATPMPKPPTSGSEGDEP
jgi:HK97 family phage portal protein